MKTQLKKIACFSKGQQINGEQLLSNGKYDYLNGGIYPSGKWSDYNVEGDTIAISEGGNSCGYVNYMESNFWCGGHCYYLYDVKCSSKYLYYALKSQQDRIMKLRSGACMPNIKKKDLADFVFEYNDNSIVQKKVVLVLDTLESVILSKQLFVKKLDELIKSRFIEMFGLLRDNNKHFKLMYMKDVCRRITDGKHGGCEKDDNSGYYFVGAREIYDDSIHYDSAPQILASEFEKDYKRCNLEQGDLVIVNTGATIGKSAIAKSQLTEHTLLQKSVALIKVSSTLINVLFLKYCYNVNTEMYLVESSSAQPNLLLSRIKNTLIYVPPIELQTQFADFVTQVEKQKATVQQSIDKLETLKKSLMQEYFG